MKINTPENMMYNNDVEVVSDIDFNKFVQAKLQSPDFRKALDDNFYICDLGQIMIKHKEWLQEFPKILPHYTVRCNPDKMLLLCLISMGVSFNCHNKNELKLLLELGADPDKIFFANPCKQTSHVKFAAQYNVKTVEFDSLYELEKLKKYHPYADLVLRISLDESTSDSDEEMTIKFGASMAEAEQLLVAAKEMHLNVVGISFEIDSDVIDVLDAYKQALECSKFLIEFSKKKLSADIPMLCVNGETYTKVANPLNDFIDACFPARDYPELKLIGGVGSFYAKSAFTAVTNVVGKKQVSASDFDAYESQKAFDKNGIGFSYYMNDGVYGCFNIVLNSRDAPFFTPSLLNKVIEETSPLYPTTIWGPTCDALDKVLDLVYLPELEVGDWIMWKNIGAYTMALKTNFNGFKSDCVHYFIRESVWEELQYLLVENEKKRSIFSENIKTPELMFKKNLKGANMKSTNVIVAPSDIENFCVA